MNRLLTGIAILLALGLNACDDTTEKPSFGRSSLSGTVAIGKVSSANITAYDFDGCRKGAVIDQTGQQATDQYQFNIDNSRPNIPILLEASNITYREDKGGREVQGGDSKLYSLLVIGGPGEYQAAITYWTSLAYARTLYHCSQDSGDLVGKINDSNDQFTQALGFDPLRVQPISTTVASIGIDQSNGMRYGLANAALSYFTYTMDQRTGSNNEPHVAFNSITFAQLAMDDMVDGALNGYSAQVKLSFADLDPLDAHVYRAKIADQMSEAQYQNKNKPGFDSSFLLGTATSFNESQMDIFAQVPPIPFGDSTAPVITPPPQVTACSRGTVGNSSVYDVTVTFSVSDLESSFEASANFNCNDGSCCNGAQDLVCYGVQDTISTSTASPGSTNNVGLDFRYRNVDMNTERKYIQTNFTNRQGKSLSYSFLLYHPGGVTCPDVEVAQ